MADVQLEHGHIRIANALYGAINLAPFNLAQLRAVLAILRLTYGWDRKSVRISQPELAERCGFPVFTNGRPGGSFRESMAELLASGVVKELEPPVGSTPAAYAINKNFEEWGQFSIAANRVQRLFGERPSSIDRRPANRPEKQRPPDRPEENPTARSQAVQRPAHGPSNGPVMGQRIPPNSLQSESVSPTDRQDIQEIHDVTTRAREDDSPKTEPPEYAFARAITGAANNAITAKWGEQTRPLIWSTATQFAFELIQRNVDVNLARNAIAESIRASKSDKPPRSMNYFANVIDDAAKAHDQRAVNAEHPAPTPSKSNHPTRLSSVLSRLTDNTGNGDRSARERALRIRYDSEKADAGIAWGKRDENDEAYRAIVAAANEHYAAMIEQPWGQRGRDRMIIDKCADASGFPAFAAWSASESGAKND